MSFPESTPYASRRASLSTLLGLAAFVAIGPAAMHEAHALSVSSASPTGRVDSPTQVVLKLDKPGPDAGTPDAAAPAKIVCNGNPAKGDGHWNHPREWVFDFKRTLNGPAVCEITTLPEYRSASGEALKRGAWKFQTGEVLIDIGSLSTSWEGGERIDERAIFSLVPNTPIDANEMLSKAHCSVEGIGERISLQPLSEEERLAALKAQYGEEERYHPKNLSLARCARTLPENAKVTLAVDKGVLARIGMRSERVSSFDSTVRGPLKAEFRCERENAQAACNPLLSMSVHFSAPIPLKSARSIVLKTSAGKQLPSDASKIVETAEDSNVQQIQFRGPLPEATEFTIELPAGLVDESKRPLANAGNFPLKVRTAPMPPLAKFPAGSFGIVERHAEGIGAQPLLPMTVRNIELDAPAKALTMKTELKTELRDLKADDDAQVIGWINQVRELNYTWPVDAADLKRRGYALPPIDAPRKDSGDHSENAVSPAAVSILDRNPQATRIDLPSPDGKSPQGHRPFEVIGIPLSPGFHVLEVGSRLLGSSLLSEQYGKDRSYYVRTAVLVTNLGVHTKTASDALTVWVTRLDNSAPVGNARVQVSNCRGESLASGTTDAQGLVTIPNDKFRATQNCGSPGSLFVSARHEDDYAFVWNTSTQGIEGWRWGWSGATVSTGDTLAHTMLDRSLFRAGETVSMRHVLRDVGAKGLQPSRRRFSKVVVQHVGTGDEFEIEKDRWAIPKDAKLGEYTISLRSDPKSVPDGERLNAQTASFRVEEFKLPTMTGDIDTTLPKPAVSPKDIPVQVRIGFMNGGPAAKLPVQITATTSESDDAPAEYRGYSFMAPPDPEEEAERLRRSQMPAQSMSAQQDSGLDEESGGEGPPAEGVKMLAQRQPLTLDASGSATMTLKPGKPLRGPTQLQMEATFADPNGEIQTISGSRMLYPAAVRVGLRSERWVNVGKDLRLQALALDLKGERAKDVKLVVNARSRKYETTRKRMVGGFYSYDTKVIDKDLGQVCEGRSDERGLLVCAAPLKEQGEIQLVATATDADGRSVQSMQQVWVTGEGEAWFGSDDLDRMDLIPEKTSFKPGEDARLQVRMPFRRATALVTVERDTVLEQHVVELSGKDPTVSVKVGKDWGPNVNLTVFALRGRVLEVPWYSFFSWGWRSPGQWWDAWRASDPKEVIAPTAMVDLGKPSFRIGSARLKVGIDEHRLQVSVATDKPKYQIREKAVTKIAVRDADGKPAAKAKVTIAAVDQALLDLSDNTSWRLLEAMYPERAWTVSTATAQQEIIGRRHYGRKAAPAGGDGGAGAGRRELLDTLLLWQPGVELDDRGEASVTVPLNDALTAFRIVAIAEHDSGSFGTGSTKIDVTKDLQLIAGLAPVVRSGDRYDARATVRNGTDQPMKLRFVAKHDGETAHEQTVELAPLQSRELVWQAIAPVIGGADKVESHWDLSAEAVSAEAVSAEAVSAESVSSGASGKPLRDALRVTQSTEAATPITVRQAILQRLEQSLEIPVRAPDGAVAVKSKDGEERPVGGVQVSVQPTLANGLPSVIDWFSRYPFACLEQRVSRSIGTRDRALWKRLVDELPPMIDSNGLASFYAISERNPRGFDFLTAHLLHASDEAGRIDPAFRLPDALRDRMLDGLQAFIEGRIDVELWTPDNEWRKRMLELRKLAAMAAIVRHRPIEARLLSTIRIEPNAWPTHAILDWVQVLKRDTKLPDRAQKIEEAWQVLRGRLNYQGRTLKFTTEQSDYWWWFMQDGDVNAARLILAVLDEPEWKDEIPRMIVGFIGRQESGVWRTTTANFWGGIALERFAQVFEREPVAGTLLAELGGQSRSLDWSKVKLAADEPSAAAFHARRNRFFGAPASTAAWLNNDLMLPWTGRAPETLKLTQQGSGAPWVTTQILAAVPATRPVFAGYALKKTVTPVRQAVKGRLSRGDVLNVRIAIDARTDMTWVVLNDPVPSGATILGNGLGRDSALEASLRPKAPRGTEGSAGNGAGDGESEDAGEGSEGGDEGDYGWNWSGVSFVERGFGQWRGYFNYLSRGKATIEYNIRLNSTGQFSLPPTRIEAMYAPEIFGEIPNAPVRVEAPGG